MRVIARQLETCSIIEGQLGFVSVMYGQQQSARFSYCQLMSARVSADQLSYGYDFCNGSLSTPLLLGVSAAPRSVCRQLIVLTR